MPAVTLLISAYLAVGAGFAVFAPDWAHTRAHVNALRTTAGVLFYLLAWPVVAFFYSYMLLGQAIDPRKESTSAS